MTALLYFIPNSPRGYKEIQKEDTSLLHVDSDSGWFYAGGCGLEYQRAGRAHGKKPVFSQCLDITSYICKKECDGEESLHRVGGMSTSGRND